MESYSKRALLPAHKVLIKVFTRPAQNQGFKAPFSECTLSAQALTSQNHVALHMHPCSSYQQSKNKTHLPEASRPYSPAASSQDAGNTGEMLTCSRTYNLTSSFPWGRPCHISLDTGPFALMADDTCQSPLGICR